MAKRVKTKAKRAEVWLQKSGQKLLELNAHENLSLG